MNGRCNMTEVYKNHDIAVYAGYLDNDSEILTCSSGGIATALSRKMIHDGGYVAGAAYSEDFHAVRYEIVHDSNQLERFKGSKYVDVEKGTVYQDVKKLLDDDNRVLFFGLPCVVAALRSYLGKDDPNLLTCEMVCEGAVSSDVHRQYIEYLEKKYNSRIVEFSVRRKLDAWTPKYLWARFENGKEFLKEFRRTEYGFAFKVKGKPACYQCRFKADGRTGDLMLGDYWGAAAEDPFWNKNGVSVVFVRTEKGEDFLKTTQGICLYPSDFDRAVAENPMVVRSRAVRPEKEEFERLFRKKGLIYAARHARTFERKAKDFLLDMLGK